MSAAKVCGFRMTGQEAGAGAGCDAAAGMLAKITLLKLLYIILVKGTFLKR